jgi:transposase
MARRTIEMDVKKQIGILQSLGYGKKTIARELGLSRNTVKSYLDVSQDKDGDSPEESRKDDLYSFFPYCQSELPRTGVTRQILWGEYRSRYPDGYSYSQFCEHLKQYLDRKDISLHIEQQPGDKLYIDFAGSKMSIADPYTGEIKEMEVFVAVCKRQITMYVFSQIRMYYN